MADCEAILPLTLPALASRGDHPAAPLQEIAGISLVAGAIGILTMRIGVNERVPEIGLLMALGATRSRLTGRGGPRILPRRKRPSSGLFRSTGPPPTAV